MGESCDVLIYFLSFRRNMSDNILYNFISSAFIAIV